MLMNDRARVSLCKGAMVVMQPSLGRISDIPNGKIEQAWRTAEESDGHSTPSGSNVLIDLALTCTWLPGSKDVRNKLINGILFLPKSEGQTSSDVFTMLRYSHKDNPRG